jgi:hypothetical protein
MINSLQLEEKEKGPRTLDLDFLKKFEEMQSVEIALQKLKSISLNFIANFESIMQYNRDLTECLFLLYRGSTSSFKEFSECLTKIHLDNNLIFSSIIKEIAGIIQNTKEMPFYFYNIYPLINQREEHRKIYDHYEKKLRKMEKVFKERLVRDCLSHHRNFVESFERNKVKFRHAKENYIKATRLAYKKIDKLLNNRYDLINPVMINLHNVEKKIYESFIKNFATFKKIDNELGKVRKSNFENSKGNSKFNDEDKYDPLKFMKYPQLDTDEKADDGLGMKIRVSPSGIENKNAYNNKDHSRDRKILNNFNPYEMKDIDEFYQIKNIFSKQNIEQDYENFEENSKKIIHPEVKRSELVLTIPNECIPYMEHINLNYNQRIIR